MAGRKVDSKRVGIPPGLPFVVRERTLVYHGQQKVAIVVSATMAKRIANALNQYMPDERGQ
jgi:hypothetical protein